MAGQAGIHEMQLGHPDKAAFPYCEEYNLLLREIRELQRPLTHSHQLPGANGPANSLD